MYNPVGSLVSCDIITIVGFDWLVYEDFVKTGRDSEVDNRVFVVVISSDVAGLVGGALLG